MAAPDSKTVLNMTGIWQINRRLSDDMSSLFVLQGIPWILRKIINFATVRLHLKQEIMLREPLNESISDTIPITTIHLTQIVSPGGFNSKDSYILDSVTRESTVPVFGEIAVSAKYIPITSIEDTMVRAKFEKSGEPQTTIEEVVKGVVNGWQTTCFWGFEEVEGKRYHTRYSLTKKGDQELRLRIVYDFVSEPGN